MKPLRGGILSKSFPSRKFSLGSEVILTLSREEKCCGWIPEEIKRNLTCLTLLKVNDISLIFIDIQLGKTQKWTSIALKAANEYRTLSDIRFLLRSKFYFQLWREYIIFWTTLYNLHLLIIIGSIFTDATNSRGGKEKSLKNLRKRS